MTIDKAAVMRTQDRGYSLLIPGILVCLLTFFCLSEVQASGNENWGLLKCRICSKSKCQKNPKIAQDCVKHCQGHSGEDCQEIADKVKADPNAGQSDEAYITNVKDKFFAAINFEKKKNPEIAQLDPDTVSPRDVESKIESAITALDSKYGGNIVTRAHRDPPIQALWAVCTKNPAKNCGVFVKEALFRLRYCPPSTQKDCSKAKTNSDDFASTELTTVIENDSGS